MIMRGLNCFCVYSASWRYKAEDQRRLATHKPANKPTNNKQCQTNKPQSKLQVRTHYSNSAAIITLLLIVNVAVKHFFCTKPNEGEKADGSALDALGIATSVQFLFAGNPIAHLILYVLFGFSRILTTASGHIEMLEAAGSLGGYLSFSSLVAMALNGVIGIF
jgi:hypothetical protein